jgi:hypothetical protein
MGVGVWGLLSAAWPDVAQTQLPAALARVSVTVMAGETVRQDVLANIP